MSAQARGVRRQPPPPARDRSARTEENLPALLRPEAVIEPPDTERQAEAWSDVTAELSPQKTGYWVACPLPAYADMKVLFKTGNRTRVRQSRPAYDEPYELRRDRRRITQLRAEQVIEFSEERDREIEELRNAIIDQANQVEEAAQMAQTEWLAQFVLDFDPWPWPHLALPDPKDPPSYHVLYTELEDLYGWIVNHGYNRALEFSVKNS